MIIITSLALCSCTKAVANVSDELTASKWCSTFENGNCVYLSFEDDEADLTLSTSDKKSFTISGFCEISDSQFVIHDKETSSSFAFKYVVNFDSIDIVYDEHTLSLGKL